MPKMNSTGMGQRDKFLRILSVQYPSELSVITELVKMKAVLKLPKGTEYFLSDVHGEYEQFSHVLKNGAGSIREK